MENTSVLRRHRIAWLTLTTLGALILLPATRTLLRTQVQMQALTYSTKANLSAERAAAALLSEDFPIQLALAAETPASSSAPYVSNSDPTERNHRIAALIPRFPNNPSVYANLLRYMSQGEVRMQREPQYANTNPKTAEAPLSSPESLELFITSAQTGAALDPDNAYFPMMESIGLYATYRDSEAMAALKTAGRCTQWKEYYQDELDGQNRLQRAVYGEQGATKHLLNAANMLFPQYASLRAVARVSLRLAAEEERAGNTEEGIEVRHALMRCGGLMRSQGTSYITSLVGIAIAAIGTSNPGGLEDANLASGQKNGKDGEKLRGEKLREERLNRYYAYLENLGHAPEANWARTEIMAGNEARAIGSVGIENSVFDNRNFVKLGIYWLANNALLSGTLVLLLLGGAAALAGHIRPRKGLMAGRCAYALLIVGGIGLWQWQVTRAGMTPFVTIQNMFSNMSGPGNEEGLNAAAVQALVAGCSLLIPMLLIGLIGVVSLFQRVPLATGLGRGLRGLAIPAAVTLFVLYGASLAPTACLESVIKADVARTAQSEPHCFAEITGKPWPGDPQP